MSFLGNREREVKMTNYIPDQNYLDINELLGKTLVEVDRRTFEFEDEIYFTTDRGLVYRMWHIQDCCEAVWIEDICGDLKSLVGSPILQAEEVSNHEEETDEFNSRTWTFYKLATVNGYVTIRWCGESSGYYSESVNFALCPPDYIKP